MLMVFRREVNMNSKIKFFYTLFSLSFLLLASISLQAKVVGNKIILGSAISFTGKYSAA